jgi:hypothetical protein
MLLPLLLALTAAAPAPAAPARTVMLTRFERLRVSGPYVVEVMTGGRTGAEVLGDREAAERVTVQVDSGILTIRPLATTQDGFAAARGPVTIRITTTSPLQAATVIGGARVTIDRLSGARVDTTLNGTGALTVAGVKAEQLVAALVGTGTLTLAGTARQARLAASGSGSFDASALDARELVLRSEGAGSGRFRAGFSADVSANGAGTIEIAGTPKCQVRGTAAVRCGAER